MIDLFHTLLFVSNTFEEIGLDGKREEVFQNLATPKPLEALVWGEEKVALCWWLLQASCTEGRGHAI